MSTNLEDKLIENENLPLEDLLDHEEVLNEFKFSKIQKINSYLDNSKIKKLIDLSIKEPIDDSFKYGHKYPFISSELLSSEIQIILDKFFPEQITSNLEESKSILLNLSDSFSQRKDEDEFKGQKESPQINIITSIDENPDDIGPAREIGFIFNPPAIEFGNTEKERDNSFNLFIEKKFCIVGSNENYELLDYLFSFLNSQSISNPILCGNFAKIVTSFFKVKNQQLVRYICNKRQDILVSLISNLGFKSICDIMVKLLLSENCLLEESINFDILKVTLLNKLILYLQNKNISEDEVGNLSGIFSEFFENSKNTEIISNEQFLNNLTNLWSSKYYFSLREGLTISNQVIRLFRTEYEKAQKFLCSVSIKSKLLEKTNFFCLDQDNILINKFSLNLDSLLLIFSNSNEITNDYSPGGFRKSFNREISSPTLPSSIGSLRISIIELLYNLLGLSRNIIILEKLKKYKFFEVCLSYLFHFYFNDILTYYIQNIILLLIEEANETYVDHIINGCALLSEIMRNCDPNECLYIFNSKKKCLKGYYISCVKISQAVHQLTERNEKSSRNIITGNPSFEEFIKFYEQNINPYIEKMNYTLCGLKTNQMNILSLIENNEDFFAKRFDFEQELNKKIDNIYSERKNDIKELVDEIKEENNFNKYFLETGKKEEITDSNEENLTDSISVDIISENAEYYDNNYWQIPSNFNL